MIVADEAGSAPDIFWMGARASFEVINGDRALPLNDFMSQELIDDLQGPIMDMATVNGKVYLHSTTTDVRVLYYRKDIFKEVGLDPSMPPRTWDDLIGSAKKLTTPDRWGFGFVGGKTIQTAHLWMVHGWMGGGELIDANRKATYATDAFVKAGQYYADLVQKHKVAPKEAIAAMYPDLERGMIGGNYAMSVMGSWSYGRQFLEALGEEKIGWTRIPIPQGGKDASFSGGWGYMISSHTEHPREAWAFIEHMASKEVRMEQALLLKLLPTRKSIIADPRINSTYSGQMAAYASEASGFNPKNDKNGPFFDGMIVAVQEFIQGSKSPKQALDDAVKDYNSKY